VQNLVTALLNFKFLFQIRSIEISAVKSPMVRWRISLWWLQVVGCIFSYLGQVNGGYHIYISFWNEMCDFLCEEVCERLGNKILHHELKKRTGGIIG